MRPPRFAERLLVRWVPRTGAAGPTIPGDLADEYRAVRRERGRFAADAWYVGQVLAVGLPYAGAALAGRVGALGAGLRLDVRAAARSLARTPGLVVVAIVSLAFGTGLTSAAVAVVDGIWFAPLPWPEAHRLVDLEDTHPVEVCAGCSAGTSYAAWREWRELGVFEAVAAFDARDVVLTVGEAARAVRVSAVAGPGFDLLDLPVAFGRGLTPADGTPAAAPVVVLAHDLWVSAFGADPEIVGRTIHLG
ncbi:MAG: ABC transporter permease, partial [Longimicrobiales bacterium]